jgi:hypothetical protein
VNPARIRACARAVKQRAKTDRLSTPANAFTGDPGDTEIMARFADQVRPGPATTPAFDRCPAEPRHAATGE